MTVRARKIFASIGVVSSVAFFFYGTRGPDSTRAPAGSPESSRPTPSDSRPLEPAPAQATILGMAQYLQETQGAAPAGWLAGKPLASYSSALLKTAEQRNQVKFIYEGNLEKSFEELSQAWKMVGSANLQQRQTLLQLTLIYADCTDETRDRSARLLFNEAIEYSRYPSSQEMEYADAALDAYVATERDQDHLREALSRFADARKITRPEGEEARIEDERQEDSRDEIQN